MSVLRRLVNLARGAALARARPDAPPDPPAPPPAAPPPEPPPEGSGTSDRPDPMPRKRRL